MLCSQQPSCLGPVLLVNVRLHVTVEAGLREARERQGTRGQHGGQGERQEREANITGQYGGQGESLVTLYIHAEASLSLPLTGVRAKAWCPLIYAEASLSNGVSQFILASRPVAESADNDTGAIAKIMRSHI